jgi:hypothetical protein
MNATQIRLALAVCPLALAAQAQAQVLNPFNGHYYEYVQTRLTWQAAVDAAAARSFMGMQGYLVTVTSEQESNFIFDSVTSATVWAGGSDAAKEGTWVWQTGPEAGQVFSYTRWSGGEPNNSGNEDAVHINWSGKAWNDINAGSSYGYVVEYSAAPIPEPGTYALMAIGLAGLAGLARRRR